MIMIESIEDKEIVAAIEESWWELLQYLSSTPWGRKYEDKQVKMVYTKPFDGVVTANLNENNIDSKITEITDWFSKYTKKIYWWLTPNMKPVSLSEYLIANGFQLIRPVRAHQVVKEVVDADERWIELLDGLSEDEIFLSTQFKSPAWNTLSQWVKIAYEHYTHHANIVSAVISNTTK